MTYYEDSQTLTPAISVIAHWDHKQSVHKSRDGVYEWAQKMRLVAPGVGGAHL